MPIKIRNKALTPEQKAQRLADRQVRQEMRDIVQQINAMLDALKASNFNPLTNGQKFDTLRDDMRDVLKILKVLAKNA